MCCTAFHAAFVAGAGEALVGSTPSNEPVRSVVPARQGDELKIVVYVRIMPWTEEEIHFTPDGRGVDPGLLAFELGDGDLSAIEAALQVIEGHDGEVVLVTVGDQKADAPLRLGLAMGAHRAIRVDASAPLADALFAASLLSPVVAEEQPQLVLCGARSLDAMTDETGGALAAFLGWPCAAVASRLAVANGRAIIRRKLGNGVAEVVELATPGVVTVQAGSYQPRHPSLKALKNADNAPVDARQCERPPASAVIRRIYRPTTENTAQMLDGEFGDVITDVANLFAGRVP
jgi:electron transfer flavoprotein beta subunit